LRKLFADTPLAEATRRVAEGGVIDEETGEVFKWQPEPMVLPVSEALQQRMQQETASSQAFRFRLRKGSS
ncbi:MAG: hypothetical protein AAF657_23575, partial [Acidobacteriota bacterium]